jgi:riboflavin synthase alpha subunit
MLASTRWSSPGASARSDEFTATLSPLDAISITVSALEGDAVNIEVDQIAHYAGRLMEAGRGGLEPLRAEVSVVRRS